MQSVKEYFQGVGLAAANVGSAAVASPARKRGIGIRTAGKYLLNLLVSLDQLGNTVLGGSPDETISSRVGRNYPGTIFEKAINWAFFWDKGTHCHDAIEPEDHGDDAIFK